MNQLPISQLPIMEEQEATGEIKQIFDDIRREMEVPFVPVIYKVLATSPMALTSTWETLRNVQLRSTLPPSLVNMIGLAVSSTNRCPYCTTYFKISCKTLGVDEETLEALASDFEVLSPRRVQEVIKFAVKCAATPLDLTQADYERVREVGVSDEELLEIVALAAVCNFTNTLARALKVQTDPLFVQAPER